MILEEKVQQDLTARSEPLLSVFAAAVVGEIVEALRDRPCINCACRVLVPILFREFSGNHEHNLRLGRDSVQDSANFFANIARIDL